jgi:hypothetical protein
MIHHFTSKAFLVSETRWFEYGVEACILGVFSTRERAVAAIAAQTDKYKLEGSYCEDDPNPCLGIDEISVNAPADDFLLICSYNE